MTTIIAKRNEDGTVDIAWDSQATAGNRKGHADKVEEINEQLHLGVAGDSRFGNILRFAGLDPAHPDEFKKDSFDALEYLVACAVPTWIKALRDAEHLHKEKEDWADGHVLIAMKGRIFMIYHDFSVVEVSSFGGIGSGSSYAMGALANGATVERALEIAAELDPFTGGELNDLIGV